MSGTVTITKRLSKPQRAALMWMGIRGACSRESAISARDHRCMQPQSVGSLINRGLAEKAIKRSGRSSQITVYWLTPAGLVEYRNEQGL